MHEIDPSLKPLAIEPIENNDHSDMRAMIFDIDTSSFEVSILRRNAGQWNAASKKPQIPLGGATVNPSDKCGPGTSGNRSP